MAWHWLYGNLLRFVAHRCTVLVVVVIVVLVDVDVVLVVVSHPLQVLAH